MKILSLRGSCQAFLYFILLYSSPRLSKRSSGQLLRGDSKTLTKISIDGEPQGELRRPCTDQHSGASYFWRIGDRTSDDDV